MKNTISLDGYSGEKLLKTLEKNLPEKYNYMYMGLYGSQNYHLDTEDSDVDAKAIVVPNLGDLINNREVSKTYGRPEEGLVDVKDIRIMFQQFLKMNVNFLEILFTKEFATNLFFYKEVVDLRVLKDDIVASDVKRLAQSNFGMMKGKMVKLTKPTPSTENEIKKYGYSGKEACHIIRMGELLEGYLERGLSFGEALDTRNSDKRELMLDFKKHLYTQKDAERICLEQMDRTEKLVKTLLDSTEYTKDKTIEKELKYLEEIIIRKLIKREMEEL